MIAVRMRSQLFIASALVFATLSIVAGGYASTRAAIERHNEAAVAFPLQSLTLAPPAADDPLAGQGEAEDPSAYDLSVQRAEPGSTCYGVSECAAELSVADDYSNHGQYVSAAVAELRDLGLYDGPPGQIVRTFARPDIENDGPPRADQAEENNSSDKDDKDKAPPGLTEDDEEDKDDKDKDKDD